MQNDVSIGCQKPLRRKILEAQHLCGTVMLRLSHGPIRDSRWAGTTRFWVLKMLVFFAHEKNVSLIKLINHDLGPQTDDHRLWLQVLTVVRRRDCISSENAPSIIDLQGIP